ncbi:hypothetical protein GIB67_030241 [Kingdonia uniflora]|uniref:Pentatricopeptide repeat-containing protein n=1 Tax=Kingdonia uniflora TaxID=39325 RepID=A0A7J7MNE5_9MAGN|nr:hypothetical protein GIB67_030241 [Kingdonia uniflora]
MPERDVVAHNAMISVLGKNGYIMEARKLFDGMGEKKSSSWNSMITCFCKLGDVDSARMIFDYRQMKNVVSWNAMIDGYCKFDQLTIARELFDCIGYIKNNVTWNTMISAYIQYKEFGRALLTFRQMQAEHVKPVEITMVYGKEAIDVFLKMKDQRMKLDRVICIGNLCGCSHSGLVSEGRKYFSKMLGVYGIHPGVDHYGCMVNLLGRARNLMIKRGFYKTPGCSSIEVDNVFNKFMVGDTSHPQFTQINTFLDEIAKKLNGLGHEPDKAFVFHDIDEVGKKRAH